jgi:ribonuclease J
MSLKLTPLGGLAQIGGNSMLVESATASFIIDYGILFPRDDLFDINYLIPNITELEKMPDFLVVTHGHEDHIGAIPHLLEKFPNLSIIAPPFAAELIRRKCDYYPRPLEFSLQENIRETLIIGDFKIDYVKVNHSIPDTYGIHIAQESSKSSCFFISDFKIDETGYFEAPFEFENLKRLSKGYENKLLLADSTNILSSNLHTPSEQDLINDLDKIMMRENSRIILTTFSSNISRISTAINSARKHGRKVIFYGRSILKYAEVAHQCGFIDDISDVKDIDDADTEKGRCLVIVSGCQADFKSTFRRIAYNQDSRINLRRDDLVVLSSKTIPGNEKNVSMALNEIARQGAEIITASDMNIHASGHAGKDDIIKLFNEYGPTHHIPIHGETFFLKRHGQMIKDQFSSKVKVIENFTTVNYPSFKEFTQFQNAEPILIHAKGLPISRDAIRERRKVASQGLVVIALQNDKGKSIINFMGITFENVEDKTKVIDLIKRQITINIKNTEQIRIASRRVITNLYGLKPVVIIQQL